MMASSLIGGFLKSGAVAQAAMSVAEPVPPLREKHAAAGLFTSADNLEVARRADVIFLAVKPDVIPDVLRQIASTVGQAKLIVSIAAGVSLQALQAQLQPGARVIRVMPNLPCLVGECAAGFCRGAHATAADSKLVGGLLGTVGRAEEVPEKLMDAVTGLSGSGPAYGFLMVEAMADAGVRMGLPRPIATTLAAQTLRGAATMVLAGGKHPGELKDMVCSPGGTTIAGVEALEYRGFRAAAIAAVVAATTRSAELRAAAENPKAKL